MSNLFNLTATLLLLVLTTYILSVGQSLLIPFISAIVIWYLILTIAHSLRQTLVFGQTLPRPLAILAAFGICFSVLYGVFELLISNVNEVIRLWPHYQERLTHLATEWIPKTHWDVTEWLTNLLKELNVVSIVTGLATLAAQIAKNMGIITIYVLFLLLETHSFDKKIEALCKDKKQLDTTRHLIEKIGVQIQSYIKIKTLLSLATAGISYVILRSVGVSFAEFWALLIFLFNYIPTIGSIVATILPCLLTLVQFDTLTPFFIVAGSLTLIQFIIGNILEPKLMSHSFNLSGLVIILGLTFWGTLWGVPGMFLCVPLMVIANIILANFPSTRPVAILLSSDGDIQ